MNRTMVFEVFPPLFRRKLLFDGSQVTDDIFSQDFRSLLANLLCSAVEAKHAKLNECKINESRNRAREEERGAKSKDFLSQVVSYMVSAFKGKQLTLLVPLAVPFRLNC